MLRRWFPAPQPWWRRLLCATGHHSGYVLAGWYRCRWCVFAERVAK